MEYKDLEKGKFYVYEFKSQGEEHKIIILYEGNPLEFRHFISSGDVYTYSTYCTNRIGKFRIASKEEENRLREAILNKSKPTHLKRVKKYLETEIINDFQIY